MFFRGASRTVESAAASGKACVPSNLDSSDMRISRLLASAGCFWTELTLGALLTAVIRPVCRAVNSDLLPVGLQVPAT